MFILILILLLPVMVVDGIIMPVVFLLPPVVTIIGNIMSVTATVMGLITPQIIWFM